MQKKRGAQLGNRNAFKHGLFSSMAKRNPRYFPNPLSPADLTYEVEFIQAAIVRFLQALDAATFLSRLQPLLASLRLVNLRAHSANSLLSRQLMLEQTDPGATLRELEPYLLRESGSPAFDSIPD
jgi:hypothetical protein